jgi:hypothetical protein
MGETPVTGDDAVDVVVSSSVWRALEYSMTCPDTGSS